MFDIINLILLIIVIFILIMLRSVLGRRTGLEKPVIIDFDEHKVKQLKQIMKMTFATHLKLMKMKKILAVFHRRIEVS